MKPLSPDKPRNPKKSKFTSDSIDQLIQRWFMLFWLGSLLMITIVIFCVFFLPLLKSLIWHETPCQIIQSEIAVDNIKVESKRTFNVAIKYKYVFNGVEYEGGKYNFDEQGTILSPMMESITAKYPVGLKTNCYVNPNDPTKAVLYRGPYLHLLFCLVPLGMLLGGVFFYLSLRKLKKV
jgi:hypothetical protein